MPRIAAELACSPQAVHQLLGGVKPKRTRGPLACTRCGRDLGARGFPEEAGLCLRCLKRDGAAAFADRLRAHRLAAGLSRRALCTRAGLSGDTVHCLELGENRPYPSTVQRLAAALGVKAADLDPLRGGG